MKWEYTGGYSIHRTFGNAYYVATPDGSPGVVGSLLTCHEWLTARDCWPIIRKGGAA